MSNFFEFLVFIINILLVFAAGRLAGIVDGSIFSTIPKLIGVMAVALTIHSGLDLFVTGPYESFAYGLTALIVTFAYLALSYGIYLALKQILKGGPK